MNHFVTVWNPAYPGKGTEAAPCPMSSRAMRAVRARVGIYSR